MIEAKGAMKVYTGIGSRETPGLILALMGRISARMDRLGFTLRSGGADGADAAFEANSSSMIRWVHAASSASLSWRNIAAC